ncbi:GIY-YIG nuclease family protein [Novosphingobium sp. BW1]|uniref:GIY-YIG nuclease family protein n=1 Tax=Novosphingobium sp. BW1 TaxID=2592621 RepID=UPI0011DE7206|nr:GIY-YIG nuclease family protein [Novosphingobium sp. BW1]TYC81551.1 GIY-YIG nuclease family protein [Novosphingobium sp. BW1]
MIRAVGRSLELYYIDGRPDGMLTAELFNWTGHVLMAPRTQIKEALARPEAGYAGVYLLLGEQDGEPRAYVGEGEDISARIKSHDVNKEWWSSAVLITAAANKLNKAHVRYLEARLITEARSIGRTPLDNGNSPTVAALSEADVAKMEAFLENLFIVLPAVRVDMFIQRTRSQIKSAGQAGRDVQQDDQLSDEPADDRGERFRLQMKREDFTADAILTGDGEFVVLAGSQARSPQNLGSYGELYHELKRAGVIAPDVDGKLQFVTSYAFKSPSAAATIARGSSANGAMVWKHVGSGLTYKDWEAKRLSGIGEQTLKELGL